MRRSGVAPVFLDRVEHGEDIVDGRLLEHPVVTGAGDISAAGLHDIKNFASLAPDALSAEGIAAAWSTINSVDGMRQLQSGFEQPTKFAAQAAKKLGLDLG